MLTDYKTQRITFHNDGTWTVAMRIYEGDITTKTEGGQPITRYRRNALLSEETLSYSAMKETAVHDQLKTKLATDKTRTPIDEQKIV